MPFIVTFSLGKVAVQDSNFALHMSETRFKSLDGLWRECNFWH